jgi:hypothetical protein
VPHTTHTSKVWGWQRLPGFQPLTGVPGGVVGVGVDGVVLALDPNLLDALPALRPQPLDLLVDRGPDFPCTPR